MPTKRVLTLALTCLLLLSGCPTSSGSDESTTDDSDGIEEEPVEEVEPEPGPAESDSEMEFVAVETFAENGPDSCGAAGDADGLSEIPCTAEFDTCEAGTVGDLPAVRCDGVAPRDGTVLSLAIQRQAVAGGINLQWGCQAEPEPGTTNCIFNVFENAQVSEACEYEGEIVDDALVLSLPSACDPIPAEFRQRLEDSTDIVGQTSIAAAFLDDQDLPVVTQIGATAPISIEELAAVL
ncbi:MAG TPA: hypothetical protein VMW08_08280 [Acidimicrobiales bacterium]|nr:hypothetical protein [Acidimicrobiales bacterium]